MPCRPSGVDAHDLILGLGREQVRDISSSLQIFSSSSAGKMFYSHWHDPALLAAVESRNVTRPVCSRVHVLISSRKAEPLSFDL